MFQVVLKDLREGRKLSQRDLAKLLGVSASTVGMWESGKREPNLDTLSKIANFFGVTVDYMMGKDRTMTRICRGIIQLLRYKDMTIDELAQKIGVDSEKLENILNSQAYGISDYYNSIAKAFDMDKTDLILLTATHDLDYKIKASDIKKPVSEEDRLREENHELFDQLPKEKKQEALNYLRFLVEHQGKE